MAVYKRNYKPYEGVLTADWSRFLVPARYALETLFQSRLLVGFMVAVVDCADLRRYRDLPALQSERDHVAAFES